MKTVAIYSRKSKFTDKGESIANQIQLCKEYAERLGINEFIIYDKDEGFSGGNINRPDFQRMMKDAKAKKFDTLICYRLDRIGRSVADFSTLFQELQELGIGFVSIREQFDTSTPMGRAMMYIASVFAQLERETTAERVRDNMLELAKSGRWLGGQTPLGFESEAISYFDAEMKERKMYKLSPVAQEMEIVRLIYQKYLEYESLSQVLKYLLSNNIKTKQGCDWNKKSIQAILTNVVYVRASKDVFDYLEEQGITVAGTPDGKHGMLTYNKKQGRKVYRGTEEWIAAVAKHEGVINADTWLKVQKQLEANKEKAPRLGKTNTALLTGLLRCAKCGSTMRVSYGGISPKTGEKIYYYTCSMKNASGGTRCDNSNIRGDLLERAVDNKLKEATLDTGLFIQEIQKWKQEAAATNDTAAQRNDINKKIQNNEQAIENLVKQLSQSQDSIASKYIIAEIEKLNKEVEAYKEQLQALEQKSSEFGNIDMNLDILIGAMQTYNNMKDDCTIEERRMLLRNVIDAVYWDGSTGNVEIKRWGLGKKK